MTGEYISRAAQAEVAWVLHVTFWCRFTRDLIWDHARKWHFI